jgi:hypothetical protein
MERPTLEVADVFRRYGEVYRHKHGASMSSEQRRVMTAIEVCRTAVLGGHLERCDQCDYERNCFNSCRDRHCPKCQSLARAQWIEHRLAELLDCPYFHVVFTVPDEIAAIAYQNKGVVYDILFHTTAETLKTIGADPKHLGAEIGFFAVLHSWGQNLMFHPHLRTVSCPAGDYRPMDNVGFVAAPDSSSQCACCRACSAASFWRVWRRRSIPESCSSSLLWNSFAIRTPSPTDRPSQADRLGGLHQTPLRRTATGA